MSMVSASAWVFSCVTASVSSDSLASAIPFLKPLTALPRSSPTLRSFLVPNTRATIIKTIIQCQILKVPIVILLRHWRLHVCSRDVDHQEYVNVSEKFPVRLLHRC